MNQVTAAIALGSNLGDSLATLQAAVQQIEKSSNLQITTQSHWYKTLPMGPPQPDYINGCLCVQTCLSPEQLLQRLLEIEDQLGRLRQERWGPRTLDLDLLLCDQVVIQTSILTLPHPRLHERAFVLVPLAEILPDWTHPLLGEFGKATEKEGTHHSLPKGKHWTIEQLRQAVDCTGVERLPLD